MVCCLGVCMCSISWFFGTYFCVLGRYKMWFVFCVKIQTLSSKNTRFWQNHDNGDGDDKDDDDDDEDDDDDDDDDCEDGVHPNSHKHFIPYMGFCASLWDSVRHHCLPYHHHHHHHHQKWRCERTALEQILIRTPPPIIKQSRQLTGASS